MKHVVSALQRRGLEWIPPSSPVSVTPEHREYLLTLRERAYARYDVARVRTATYAVVANGAGVGACVGFLANSADLRERATLIVWPITLFAIGLAAAFYGQYVYRASVKSHVFMLDGGLRGETDREQLRAEREALRAGHIWLDRIAGWLFGIAVAVGLLEVWLAAVS